MHEGVGFLCYLLSSIGLTVIVVWPDKGPAAWIRERIVRFIVPVRLAAALDCYICFGFWSGLALSPLFWWEYRESWCWSGPLITPGMFWVLQRDRA